MAETEIMTVIEAAGYIRLAETTLNKMRVAGTSPQFLKMGKAVRYRRSDLDDWIGAKVVRSTSEGVI